MKKLLIVLILFVLTFSSCESKKHKEAKAFKDSVLAGYFNDTSVFYTQLPVYIDNFDTAISCNCNKCKCRKNKKNESLFKR